MRVITLGLILACLASLSAEVSAQPTQPAIAPQGDPATIPYSDFCRLYVADGVLHAQTHIPADLKNGKMIQFRSFFYFPVAGGAGGMEIEKIPETLPDGSTKIDVLGTRIRPNFVHLSRSIDDPKAGNRTIGFEERREGQGSFFMSISGPTRMNGVPINPRPPPPRPIKSLNFAEFVKDHPDETEKYLRPILQSFNCEKLLYPHDLSVAQVFPELFLPDDATKTAVKQLMSKLDSDSPDDRDAAMATLKAMGPMAIIAAQQIDPQTLSPQQSASIALLNKDRLTDQQVAELSTDKDFLVECLKDARKPVRVAALTALRKVAGREIVFDRDAGSSQRAEAAEKLRIQLFPEVP